MRLTLFLLLLFIALPAQAQQQPTLENDLERVIRHVDDKSFVTVNVENDLFGGGTDQNYTSGVRLTYHKMGAELPQFTRTMDRMVPMFRRNEATSIYYSLGQNLYTPEDITTSADQPNDRPWAAFLYASAGMISVRENTVDEIEGSLGVVGPAALGEQTQRTIHKWVNSPNPEGWDNQLKNEPGLILSWNRRWPERYGIDFPGVVVDGWSATAEPNIGITAGNIYTYANAGANFRLSPYAGRFQDAPIKVRPASPGSGAFIIPEGVFAWHLFGGVEGRAVARNIFLDGNTFTDSHSVDKKPFVYDATAGVATAYGPARISYALVYRSKEFEEQDSPSIFGTVSIGYRF